MTMTNGRRMDRHFVICAGPEAFSASTKFRSSLSRTLNVLENIIAELCKRVATTATVATSKRAAAKLDRFFRDDHLLLLVTPVLFRFR
jgi:hypothetical protein